MTSTAETTNANGAAGRRRSAGTKLKRLAAAAALLEERRDRLEELQERAEDLSRTDVIVVDGELAVMAELQLQVTAARHALASPEVAEGRAGALERLEHLVDATSWAVLDEITRLLDHKEALLEQARSEVRRALQPWTEVMAAVEPVVKELEERRAVVPNDLAAGRDRLDSLVRQRALNRLAEDQILDAWLALAELERPPTSPTPSERPAPVPASEVLGRLNDELDRVRRTSGRVQLTVLRGPLDRGRFEYTLMLLAPGAERGVAVNVQDTTTIVRQDRDWFLQVLEQVGGTAYRSLRDARPPGERPSTGVPGAGIRELEEMGAVLYKLLIPDRMKEELNQHPETPISITTNDLGIPWELMFDDSGPVGERSFLALRRPVSRMPVGRSRARRPRDPDSPRDRRRVALIASVGQPGCELPGARTEVDAIRHGLEKQWKDKVDIHVLVSGMKDKEPTGARFREVLLSGGYDIVHYAGHAAFDVARPDQSGLQLDGQEVCFAQKIQRLLQGNPLVFLNACETARLDSPDGRPPAEGVYEGDPGEGLASAFVYGGALACIGTLWPVSDQVAATFAVAFYGRVLEGQPLGPAMLEARRETVAHHPDDPSSAAFVLYGDPSFQLLKPIPRLAPSTA